MVNAAAWRSLYDATCLRRSLVLWWLLRSWRRGTLRRGLSGVGLSLGYDDNVTLASREEIASWFYMISP